jgi:chromosome segregation ATPase
VDNAFDLLEERVRRAADALRALRAENADLKKQLSRAQGALQQAERALDAAASRKEERDPEDQARIEALSTEVAALKKDREEVRKRMARLVEVLEGLD